MVQGGTGRSFPFVEIAQYRADALHPYGTIYIVHTGGKTPQGKLWEREHPVPNLQDAKMILDIALYGDECPLSPEERKERVETYLETALFNDGRFIDGQNSKLRV